jgi:hypothetical protein
LLFNENISYTNFDLAKEVVVKEVLILGVRREKKDVIRLIANRGVCREVEASNYSIILKKESIIAASP